MPDSAPSHPRYYRRFDRYDRVTHVFLMASFLGLALTGLPLRFSDADWASRVAQAWGGFEAARTVHRVCAVVLISVFVAHIARVVHRVYVQKDFSILWGPASMVPQPRDVAEMAAHFRWFVGRGPRPRFDHFTYWEKFDYWAVFWGMFVIGGSGLLLWFPTFFATFVPGWMFNVATLIHGEEALLAVGFIFTVHFFNGHLRPEKFPMDLVIFTGRVSDHDLRAERPAEYERLARAGRLATLEAPAPAQRLVTAGRLIGTTAITLGIVMVVLIFYAVLR